MAIYLKNPQTQLGLDHFLRSSFNHEYEVILKFERTYSDSECTIQQCKPARRTFPELVEICQTYFNQVTEKDVATSLLKIGSLYSFICPDIQRWVFMLYPNKPYDMGVVHDSNNPKVSDKDDISFSYIENLANGKE